MECAWCSESAVKAGSILPWNLLVSPVECGMVRSPLWNGEVSCRASLPGCAYYVKDQPLWKEASRLANLPGLCLQDHGGNNPIQKSVVFMSFQNKLELPKQSIVQPPIYLTFHGHLFPHVDTVSAK